MEITRRSQLTGIERTLEIDVTEAQLKAWHDGALIQDAMPNVSPDDREFILTGVTKEEWDELMKEDEA